MYNDSAAEVMLTQSLRRRRFKQKKKMYRLYKVIY